MSENDVSRLFDRLEQMERKEEKHHLEVMVKLAKLETDQENQQEEMARHQQAISTIEDCVQIIKQERASEKGKLYGVFCAGSLLGGVILFILQRMGIIDAFLGLK